jgi:translocation and assembly module TamB
MLWKGTVDRFSVSVDRLGEWTLEGHAPLVLSDERVLLDDFRLLHNGSYILANVSWFADKDGVATVKVDDFSVEELESFLPEDASFGLNGTLSIDSQIHTAGKELKRAAVSLKVSDGMAGCVVKDEQEISMPFRMAAVDAVLDRENVHVDLLLDAAPNSVQGKLYIPGLDYMEHIEDAPLEGSLKLFFGQPEMFDSFIPEVSLGHGRLMADMQIGGTVGRPLIKGVSRVTMNDTEIPLAGLVLDSVDMGIHADENGPLKLEGSIVSDNSTITLRGDVDPFQDRGMSASVSIEGEHFRIVNVPDAVVFISPDIDIASDSEGVRVSGTLTVPEAEITPHTIPEGVKKRDSDVVIVTDGADDDNATGAPVSVNLTLRLLDKVHVKAFGLDCHVSGELTVIQLPDSPAKATGDLRILDGTLHMLGKDLVLQRGSIAYAGGRIDNPGINILATRDVQGITVGLLVTGTLQEPLIEGYSTEKDISSQDAITMIMTGKTKNDPGFSEASYRNAAIAGVDMIAGQIGEKIGVDQVSVTSAGENSEDTRVYAGKTITKDLSVGVETGTDDDGTQVVVRYRLWRKLTLEVKSGGDRSEMSLLYITEMD